MELRHLEIFCRIYERGSFSRAAEELLLTQPTLSSHMKNLEEGLQMRLFDRLGREVVPTGAGELLYGYAREIVRLKGEAGQALAQYAGGLRGTLEIGGSTIPGEYLLPAIIGRFRKEHSEVLINLRIGDSDDVVRMIAERKVEIGIIGVEVDSSLVESRRLSTDELILVAPHSWDSRELSGEALRRAPLITRERGSGTRAAFEGALKGAGIDVEGLNFVVQMGSTEAVKQGVKAGVGLAIISSLAVKDDLDRGAMKRVEMEGLPITRHFYAVTHRLREKSPLCSAFLDFLSDDR